MIRKSIKRILLICTMFAVMIGLSACSGNSYTGDKYTNDGKFFSIDTDKLPKDYKCIKNDDFEKAFKQFVDNKITTKSTYVDVAKAFGAEGIQMTGIKYEGYCYYAWYSDKDYRSNEKVHVLVTFKKDGDKNTDAKYYAYTSVGIDAQAVK